MTNLLSQFYALLPPLCRHVLRQLIETEGLRGLSKGFSLNIIKGPITLSLSFTTYDLLRKWTAKEADSGKPSTLS